MNDRKRGKYMTNRQSLFITIGISILWLMGCERVFETDVSSIKMAKMDNAALKQSQYESEEFELNECESQSTKEDAIYEELPQLPKTGSKLVDFVPEGWEISDSAVLDFNEDGIFDYIGLLETDSSIYWDTRILFAIASDKTGGYYLDFQNENLILKEWESAFDIEPCAPLTAEGKSFTTCYDNREKPWLEKNTYTYRDGVWWLMTSESTDNLTIYCKNDWERGVGIRKKRSDAFWDMEELSEKYDIIYELSLDEPLTLEQFAMRRWRYETDWGVASILIAEEMELLEKMVVLPEETYMDYYDENCALYKFWNEENDFEYIAIYQWQNKELFVLAKEDAKIGDIRLYKDKIYYSVDIKDNVTYQYIKDNKQEQLGPFQETVGVRLNRMNLDGSEKETLFEYRYPKTQQEFMNDVVPRMMLTFEISKDEIVTEVYVQKEGNLFYRMNIDGSKQKEIR